MSKVSSSCLQHYGEVPEYLQRRNEEERRAHEDYERFVREQREQAAIKNLSEERRQTILQVNTAAHWQICPLKTAGYHMDIWVELTVLWRWWVSFEPRTIQDLKKTWDQLLHEYQGLSLVTDTMSQKSHKERLEAKMIQVESDINLIERFKTIYIPN